MLSIQGTYDGKVLKIFDKIRINSPKKVIITFLEDTTEDTSEDTTSEDIHLMVHQGGALDFLSNEQEDIYTDNDLKVKY